MAVKFFGQYLLEQGVLSKDQLVAAVRLQEQTNRSLGAYAVELEYLSTAQADQINLAQQQTDQRFGDLAVTLGFLTESQVTELLSLQRGQRIRIGQAIAKLGHMSEEEVKSHLDAFKTTQSDYQVGPVELKPDLPQPFWVSTAIDYTEKLLMRMGGLRGKRGAVVDLAKNSPHQDLLSVCIAFTGQFRARYIVSVSADVASAIALRIVGDDEEMTDEQALDGINELCNTICGNICAKLDQRGQALEIGPPESVCYDAGDAAIGVCVELHLPDGRFELRLVLDSASAVLPRTG